MRSRLVRPFLVLVFLVAIDAVLAFWSQVGGQYHLDLMFWPWKAGISLGAAALIAAITGDLYRNGGSLSRRALVYCSALIVIALIAGVVTYYYHVNEPPDEDQSTDDQPARVARIAIHGK